MRKILIPTDFSDNAWNAIKYALEYFKYERCDFYFLHSYADEVYNKDTMKSRKLLLEQKEKVANKSKEQLEQTIKRVKEICPNPKYTFQNFSMFKSLVEATYHYVSIENIDIVVMGTKGQTGSKSVSFGSNTVQVFKYVQCPVLAIPENYTYTQPKRILFPTDFMVPYKRRELKLLCDLAGSYRSLVYFLYISKIDKLSLRQEDNWLFLRENLSKPKHILRITPGKDKAKIINEFIEDNKIQMLVMVNTQQSFLESILFKSTVDKMGLQIKIPFMVMQNIER